MRTTSAQDWMDWWPDKPWLGSCSKNTTLLGGDSGCGSLCGVHWVGHGLGQLWGGVHHCHGGVCSGKPSGLRRQLVRSWFVT